MPWTIVVLTLAVWVGAIVLLVNRKLANKFCWIPVILALAGVFCSILPLAIPASIAVIANAACLIAFLACLALLKTRHRVHTALVKHRV